MSTPDPLIRRPSSFRAFSRSFAGRVRDGCGTTQSHADRGVPRRDRQGEETPSRLRNGESELGHLVSRRHPTLNRIGRHGARQHDDVESVLLRPGLGPDAGS
jgi:hypothetical protein